MTRPTRRGAALLALALVTYLAARLLGTWELYLIALAFTGMTIVAWLFVAIGAHRVSVRRTVSPERPVAGDPLEFSFVVDAGWRLPGLHVVLTGGTGGADFPGSVVVEEAGFHATRTASVGPRPARRGVYRLFAVVAVVEDPLGLAHARRDCGEPLQLTVLPRLEELAVCAVCADAGARHGGGRRRLPTRDAWEFRGIRPHTPGEPLTRVDWKSTAKTGHLMLREMEADTEDDLTVLLNAPATPAAKPAAGAGAAGQPDEAFEVAVVVAGSVAAFTLRTGHGVTVLLPDDGWRDLRLTPDASSRRRLLGALAGAEPRGLLRLGSSLPAILAERSGKKPRVLAVVTLHVDDDLARALGRLRSQGVTVSVVHVVRRDAEVAAAAFEATGVRYVALAPGDDLHAALAADTVRAAVPAGSRRGLVSTR